MKIVVTALVLMLSQAATAQAPSGATTGATGICKDGSFTTSTVRDGACHGHKGIQTWYNKSVPSLPAPTRANAASLPAPTTASPSIHSLPAPAIAPSSTSSLAAPTPIPSLPSRPAPTSGAATASSLPAPTTLSGAPSQPAPQPAQITVQPGIAAERARMASMPPAAGGGPGMVWVNNASKVYHCPGSDFYGKTKSGAYMTEADAKASGAHPNRNKPCT